MQLGLIRRCRWNIMMRDRESLSLQAQKHFRCNFSSESNHKTEDFFFYLVNFRLLRVKYVDMK